MILELLFSIALFINGGHLIDNKFKVKKFSFYNPQIQFLRNVLNILKWKRLAIKISIVRVRIKGIMKYLTHIQYKINHKKIPLIVRGVTNSKR